MAEAAAEEIVRKEMDSLKELNTKLSTSTNELTNQLATAKEDNKKISSELVAAKEIAKSQEDNSTKLAVRVKELEEALGKAKEEMDKYQKETCKSKRKAAMAQIDVDDARADELIEKLANASDEIFDEFVKSMPKKTVKTDTTTASTKDILDNAKDKDTNLIVPSDAQNKLTAVASEWFVSMLSTKNKGE
jgi:chromosome segregation ATPase